MAVPSEEFFVAYPKHLLNLAALDIILWFNVNRC